MIKKFNLYKEGLLNKLEGPTKEEIIKNFGDDKNKLFAYAIYNKDYELAKEMILRGGIEPLKKDKISGTSSLRLIITRGDYELIDLLLENGAVFNITNDSLFFLLLYAPYEYVEKLLKYINGKTPLKGLNNTMITDLIKSRFQYNKDYINTPKDDFIKMLSLYKKLGLNFNIKMSSFIEVMKFGEVNLFKFLVNNTTDDVSKIKDIRVEFHKFVNYDDMMSIIKIIKNVK